MFDVFCFFYWFLVQLCEHFLVITRSHLESLTKDTEKLLTPLILLPPQVAAQSQVHLV
jgi:hypothetical protein